MLERAEHELQDLWKEFKDNADPEARDGLILHYSALVKFVAGRLKAGLPRSVDPQDLVSYGTFGLIDAIDKFEPERGYKFETYAVNRIKGAILDELRALDWVPRSVRARAREIERSMAELEHKLHRTPTEEELAAKLDMPLEQLLDALAEMSTLGLVALDELLSPDRGSAAVGDLVFPPINLARARDTYQPPNSGTLEIRTGQLHVFALNTFERLRSQNVEVGSRRTQHDIQSKPLAFRDTRVLETVLNRDVRKGRFGEQQLRCACSC